MHEKEWVEPGVAGSDGDGRRAGRYDDGAIPRPRTPSTVEQDLAGALHTETAPRDAHGGSRR